ncbi:MAG: chemotaxis protein CheX, partial [Pseudomonadota bacterium]
EAGRKVQETLMAKGLHGREVTFSEDLLKGLTEELLVFFWQNGVQSKERIIKIRSTLGFSDSTLVAVSDEANEERAEEALKYGADYAIALGDASKVMSIMRDKCDRALTFENAPAYVQPFIDSVCNVVSTMAYMDVSPKGIRLQHGHYLHGDISGIMGITGSGPGYIAVCFASDTARKLVAGILGQNPEDLGLADIRDGVYEATNMIAGGTKARLSGTPHHFEVTTPVVVDGVENKYTRLGEIPCLVLLFELEGDPFAVQVCLGRSPFTVDRSPTG